MIYFCIPVHNEERTIGLLLWKIRKVLAEFGRDYRILVFDDASDDDTAGVLDRYEKLVPLDVLRSEARLGSGRALERLLREAVRLAPYPKRDVVVTLQGDFTEYPGDVVELVKVIEGGADIVAGVEEGVRGTSPRRVQWARRIAPHLLGEAYSRAPVTDPLCGYRAYRVIVLKKALRDAGEEPIVTRDGWAAQLELLRTLAPHARRVEEVPLQLRYDIRQRDSRFRTLHALKDLFAVRRGGWETEGAA